MIRSTYRNLMIGILLACFGLSYYLFTTSQDFQLQIQQSNNDLIRLNQELENMQNLNVALTELDNLTITEQTATQLDILRHLGLDKSDYDFQLEARDVQSIGGTSLYIHTVQVSAKLPYAEALGLCDRLQNTKKIVINEMTLDAPSPGANDNLVGLIIRGNIYGLDKVIPPVEIIPAEPMQPEETIETEPAAEDAPAPQPEQQQ
jgi:hypothetical protein